MRQIKKCPQTKMVQNYHFYVYAKFKELFMKLAAPGGPQPPMDPPTTRDTADFNISIFYPVYINGDQK